MQTLWGVALNLTIGLVAVGRSVFNSLPIVALRYLMELYRFEIHHTVKHRSGLGKCPLLEVGEEDDYE